jgi:transcriptional regulator GlxA family with amidase domain
MPTLDVLLLDGASPSAYGITADIVDGANRLSLAQNPSRGAGPIAVRVLAVGRDGARLRAGIHLSATDIADARPGPWVVVPGLGAASPTELSERLRGPDVRRAARWLTAARNHGSTLLASCTGVFLLGEAGALDNRRCTTSWWLTGALAQRYPAAQPDTDAMVVADRGIWTAGASFAHADLMFALIEHVHGTAAGRELSGRLAFGPRRRQSGFVRPVVLAAADPAVAAIESHVAARIDRPVRLADLACAAHLSPRTLARRVRQATGLSPMELVQRIRLDVALQLLQRSDATIADIANRVGFSDAASLHRLVKQATGQAPGAFRFAPSSTK